MQGIHSNLLSPSLQANSEFAQRALQYFNDAMCRNFDRTQRALLLDKAIEAAPTFREAHFWRGILGHKSVKDNAHYLKVALSLTPKTSTQSLVIQSQICAMDRNPDLSVKLLTLALGFATNQAQLGEIYYFRAFAYWWTDKDEEAIADARKAIEYDYNVKSCYTQLADMCRFLGKEMQELEEFYKQALLPTPTYTELVKYAIFLKRSNRITEALDALNAAIRLNPASPDAFEERANISNTPDADYLAALEKDTEGVSVSARRLYAALLADREDFDKALEVLSEGISQKERPEWLLLRGKLICDFFPQNREAAIADFRRAVSINPSDPDAQFWLGRILSTGSEVQRVESAQRLRNTLYLSPEYQRIPSTEAAYLKALEVPEFKFFGDEAKNLYDYVKYGTISQYVGSTRRALFLLVNFAPRDSLLIFKIFQHFGEHLHIWASSDSKKVSEQAKKVLETLWQKTQVLPMNANMKHMNIHNSEWADVKFSLETGEKVNVDRVILHSEWENFQLVLDQNNGFLPVSAQVLSPFLHFAYRKPITVSRDTLVQLQELATRIGNKDLQEFLRQYLSQGPKETEGQSHVILEFHKVPKNLSRYIESSQFRDVTFRFTAEDSEENQFQDIHAHKAILAANCAYFQRMFTNGLRESRASVIHIPNVSREAFVQVLTHCYGGHVRLTSENCVEILRVSDEYGLPSLHIACELFIGKHVDTDNVDEIKALANLFNARRLKQHCKRLSTSQKATFSMPVESC